MCYKAEEDEVFFYGGCQRQQKPSEGTRCQCCGKINVSWRTKREDSEDAKRRWQQVNG